MRAYPDEILVSVLARYHHLNGNRGTKYTARKIYGLDHKKTSTDLPTTIRPIISQNIMDGTADEVLQNNTLFPFYRPFLSDTQVNQLQNEMLDGNGGAAHMTSGIMASVVRHNDSLRLCPSCLSEDIQMYGEPYWHREHHLPGTLVCSIHECELLTQCLICNEPASTNHSKELSICPSFCRNGHDLSRQIVNRCGEPIVKVSKGIVALFKACQQENVPSNLRDLYVRQLEQMNLCTLKKRIKQGEVRARFLSMFNAEMLTNIGVPRPIGAHDWLSRILRKPRYSFHPLLHALVIEFLWGGIHAISASLNNAPFGNAPWPCLNKIAIHYKKHTITEVRVTQCSDTKRPVGSFKCELCGFHYSRRGPDHTMEDTYSYGRVKDFGHYWKGRADAFLQKGGSIRSVARALNVDSATVKLYMKNKLVQIVDVPSKSNELDSRRACILQTINNLQNNKCTDVRKNNSKDYSWLYKNDREWLKSLMQRHHSQSIGKPRVNWNQRDKEIANEINDVIIKLRMKQNKPERLTLSRIGRSIGKLALLERHLDKLPICQGLLKINLETEETHQIRRIAWAIERIKQHNIRPTKWRVLREAGIRVMRTGNVELHLITMINEALFIFKVYDSA